MQTSQPERSLRRELQYAQGFSAWALLLAVLGSVAGTIFTSAFGTGHWGTLAGAAVGPVISTTFSTKYTGERGRVRNATIIILSIAALLITVTGFTFADRVAGKSILPGPDPQAGPSSTQLAKRVVHRRSRRRVGRSEMDQPSRFSRLARWAAARRRSARSRHALRPSRLQARGLARCGSQAS